MAADPAVLAKELDTARKTRRVVPQLSLRHPELSIEDAYAIQRAWVSDMVADGRRVVGRKIGLTSRVMQRAMDITEPDYGAVTDDMVFDSGDQVPADRFIGPRVEVELAFVLGRRLRGPHATVADVLDATSHIVPAIEILDSRVAMTDPASGHRRTIVDTIADNAADAGMILGTGLLRPDRLDPRAISALLYVNGVIEETGVASAVLGNPALGVAWLANRLAPYGEALEEGQAVLSGSFIRAVNVGKGDVVHADFAELGAVTCRFV